MDGNPFANLQLEQPRGRSQHPTITEDELHDLGHCALVVHGQGYGQVYRAFILATGYVGCRLNEGLNLEHRDLRPREREVDLRVTKFSKPRTVLLLPEAWDTIRSIPRQAKHDRVWYAKRGAPLAKGNHQSLWTPIRALWWGKLSEARRRELVDFDWHSLRHFTAHYFYVVRGFGAELAAYQLGHTDPHLVIRPTASRSRARSTGSSEPRTDRESFRFESQASRRRIRNPREHWDVAPSRTCRLHQMGAEAPPGCSGASLVRVSGSGSRVL